MRYPTHTPEYPWRWAEGVVDEFIEKYARVVLFIARKLDISPGRVRYHLIECLRTEPNRFNQIRDALKVIEREDLYAELSKLPRIAFHKYLTFARLLALERRENIEIKGNLLDGLSFED